MQLTYNYLRASETHEFLTSRELNLIADWRCAAYVSERTFIAALEGDLGMSEAERNKTLSGLSKNVGVEDVRYLFGVSMALDDSDPDTPSSAYQRFWSKIEDQFCVGLAGLLVAADSWPGLPLTNHTKKILPLLTERPKIPLLVPKIRQFFPSFLNSRACFNGIKDFIGKRDVKPQVMAIPDYRRWRLQYRSVYEVAYMVICAIDTVYRRFSHHFLRIEG